MSDYSDIHPPNVVLVSSGTGSPLGQPYSDDHGHCSPLSTTPNSPNHRYITDDEDEDDEEEEIRPEEIQELLDTPASPSFLQLPTFREKPRDVPFDEQQQVQPQKPSSSSRRRRRTSSATTTDPVDPLLGNPRLRPTSKRPLGSAPAPSTSTYAHAHSSSMAVTTTPTANVVSPFKEEIDAYVNEEEDDDSYSGDGDDELSDEKKDDVTPPPPASLLPKPPINYASYLAKNGSNHYNNTIGNKRSPYDRVTSIRSTLSEDSSVPMDERHQQQQHQQQQKHQPRKDIIYSSEEVATKEDEDNSDFANTYGDTNNQATSSASASASATSGNSEEDLDPRPHASHNNETNVTATTEDPSPMKKALKTAEREVQEMERRVQAMIQQRSTRQLQQDSQEVRLQDDVVPSDFDDDYALHEPPSLSPVQPVQVNSSLESGSYYYDGSVMGSSRSHNSSSVNNKNNNSLNTTMSSLPQQAVNISEEDDHDLPTRDLSRDYYKLPETQEKRRRDSSDIGSSSSHNYFTGVPSSPSFTANFDTAFDTAFDKAFDDAIDNTARAFTQVTDGLASYVLGSHSCPPSQNQDDAALSPPDSDATPQLDNLSPRPKARQDYNYDDPEKHLERIYRRSDKIARARSLVGKSISSSSSSKQPLSPGSRSNADRARQVIQQRQRAEGEQQNASRVYNKSPAYDKENKNKRSDSGVNYDVEEDADGILPVPPTLCRIAAMIEGLTTDEDNHNGNKDEPSFNGNSAEQWRSSVSHMMEEYQCAITESLRNLSMEEVADLAGSPTTKKYQQKQPLGKDTSVPIETQANNIDYDGFVANLTMGGCLEMPQLDHPVQDNNNVKDYGLGKAGILHHDHDQHYQYNHHDPEHEERAVFAKQLSERLLGLPPVNSSTDTGSTVYQESPEKGLDRRDYNSRHQQQQSGTGTGDQDISFQTNESSFDMSPPKRTHLAGLGSTEGGFYASKLPQNTYLPTSDHPSISSDQPNGSVANSRMDSPDRDLKTEAHLHPQSKHEKAEGIPSVTKPTMVESIDTEVGIAKGDVVLSLLCDNSFQATNEKPDSWAWRVKDAMWRCRDMRRNYFGVGGGEEQPSIPDRGIKRAQSCPVDVDDVRVVGGIKNVATIQEKALTHLQRDEFEEALELYEDIIFNYYSFFEQVLGKRDEFSSQDVAAELSNFKPYIGASLHNLGVIHLLKGDYEDSFSFFKRAVENRRSCLGEDHSDTITSLVRLATCRFAMDNFADAHTNLELALALAGNKARTSKDYCQLGEILNNLGCLSYMCGQPTKAMRLFREALDVQLAVQNSTLYSGSKYAGHSITLNISIVRGNIGFLALVLKDVSSGIVALESALREQRLLLRGAHVTLVSTMDHLAVANLLEGRTQKALKMLRRIFELQNTEHGPNDPRCLATRHKILTIRGQQASGAPTQAYQQTSSAGANNGSTDGGGKLAPQAPAEQFDEKFNGHKDETKDGAGDGGSSARCTRTGTSGNNSGSTKQGNSLFKAIRSFGRKKSS